VRGRSHNNLGERIGELRAQRDMTLKQLSERLQDDGLTTGFSIQHLSQVERGETWPSLPVVQALDAIFRTNGLLVRLLKEDKYPGQQPQSNQIRLTAHLLFPVCLAKLPPHLDGPPHDFDVLTASAVISAGSSPHALYTFPFDVAVLHERHSLEMDSIAQIASWRREHIARSVRAAGNHLAASGINCEVIDPDPYCLSVFEVHDLPWPATSRQHRATQLLSMPSMLVSEAGDPLDTDAIETLLDAPNGVLDTADFSLARSHCGFASWAAVVVFPYRGSAFASRVIDFEIQLQALWCYASNVEAVGAFTNDDYSQAFLRQTLRKLQRPRPTEHTSERQMREAVIRTSRIADIVSLALDATRN
jgi:transcriptional regulator with XRE-family HTH domain